jgi:hypothetical protein
VPTGLPAHTTCVCGCSPLTHTSPPNTPHKYNRPYPSMDYVGAVAIRASAYTSRGGALLAVSELQVVHLDLRYISCLIADSCSAMLSLYRISLEDHSDCLRLVANDAVRRLSARAALCLTVGALDPPIKSSGTRLSPTEWMLPCSISTTTSGSQPPQMTSVLAENVRYSLSFLDPLVPQLCFWCVAPLLSALR